MTYALAFLPIAWEDYLYWQQTEKAGLKATSSGFCNAGIIMR